MDLDSIIYIVIAIGLAIINAVAQKKKKAARQSIVSQPKVYDPYVEPADVAVADEEEKPPIVKFQEILKEIANEPYFEEEPEALQEVQSERETSQFVHEALKESVLDAPIPAEHFYAKTEYVPLDIPEGAIDSIGEYDYNSEENSISSGAIGDALTAKEESEKREKAHADFRKMFDPKKAIIYSEIIKPKYF